MEDSDKPIIDMPALRRDLYFVMSLLLADREVDKVKGVVEWTQDIHENEVRKLLLWIAMALRNLLDSQRRRHIEKMPCGEYWPDFSKVSTEGRQQLTFRQACNSIIHAKTILNYKVPEQELDETVRRTYLHYKVPKHELKKTAKRTYDDRITVKSTHKGKNTYAQLDIVRFVQIAHTLINAFEKDSRHANL